jgi:hypothetical protein
VRVTIFPTVLAGELQAHAIDWPALVQSCLNPPEYPTKRDCPLIKLAAFGTIRTAKGALRHDSNVLAVSGLEGDYDAGEVTPEAAAMLLQFAGIEAVVYTSPSHTPEAPRWRVLAPLSREYPPTARRDFLARLNGALGGILAHESFTLSQTYYVGKVAGVPYVALPVAGQPLDMLADLPAIYPATAAPSAATPHEYREATPEVLADLRSALEAVPADDYYEWIAVGQSLVSLGEVGFALWSEWSATSPKHDPDADLTRWGTFTGDRTGFASIFAKAQRNGWVNPAARKPIDLSAVGFGGGAPLPSAACPSQPVAEPINGNTFATAADQVNIFAGCVYIQSLDAALVPGGDLLNKSRFDVRYGAYSYTLDRENAKQAKGAWEAFTKSQAVKFPKAHDICFRPELTPGAVVQEAGRLLANIWWPVETLRTPGDVGPFLDLLQRLLPDEHDRRILLAYMAAVIQNPGRKFQWCPVVQGAKGNGKSFLGYCVEYAVGDRYSHRPKSSDLGNKFTGWLRGKVFICVEEISTHDKRDMLEELKPLITNKRIEIQGKGADQVTAENRANFMMFVNPKGAMPIDEDERRYAVFHTAQQSAKDIVRDGMSGRYFPTLYEWADAGGYAHVAHYLASYAIPDELNPATTLMRAPVTSSTDEAIEVSLGSVEQEIREIIEGSDTPGLRDGWVSSIVLSRAMQQAGVRRLPPARFVEALRSLGYVPHANLAGGRAPSVIAAPDGGKPRLYLRAGRLEHNLTNPADIVRHYVKAQGAAFGLQAA